MNQLNTLQQKAAEYLIVNPATLQIMLLLQLNACRLNQTVLNAADTCGCITLSTAKAPDCSELDLEALKARKTDDDFSGLCPACREEIIERLGALLFYAATLANAMNISLSDICTHEIEKLDLLGYFMLM